MRFSSILSEAMRNVSTRTSKPLLALMFFVIIVGSLCVYDVTTVTAITARFREFLSAGATVSTVSSAKSVIGTACENLAGVSGARAAGALSEGEGIVFEALPSSIVPTKEVTPRFVELLAHESDPSIAGMFFSQEVALALSLGIGERVETTSGPVSVAGIFDYPDDGRVPGLGWSVLDVVPADRMFDSCWLDVPYAQSLAPSYILTAVAPGTAEKPTVGQLNARLGSNYDFGALVGERDSLLTIPSAVFVGLALGFVLVRLRRLELASALHIGVGRSALFVQILVENIAWLSAASALVVAATLVFVVPEAASDRTALVLGTLRILALAAASVLLGSSLGVALTREKHMFRYFKER